MQGVPGEKALSCVAGDHIRLYHHLVQPKKVSFRTNCLLPLTLPLTVRFLPQMANSAGTRLGRQHWTESAPDNDIRMDSINWKNSNDDDDDDEDDERIHD